MNVRAIQDVMNSQTIEYIFPFSSTFTFHTDLSMIVVSEGRKSALFQVMPDIQLCSFAITDLLFQTSVNLPLRCPPTTPSLYKSKEEISFPPTEKMAVYRSYIAACKAMGEKVQVTEETSKVILVIIPNTLHNLSCTHSISKTTLSSGVNKTSR